MRIALWQGADRRVRATGPRWVNILGQASGSVVRLASRLNDRDWRSHWTGPDLRRLTDPGDFNIEVRRSDLRLGQNRVEIVAEENGGASARSEVRLDCIEEGWSLPHSVQWDDPDSYEVTDGAWRATRDGLRCTAPGYDRMLVFGDDGWVSYDVTTQVTFHAAAEPLARAPTFGVAHVALAAHWPGHGDDMHDPHLAWHPLGVTCEWQVNPRLQGCRFRMLFGTGRMIEETGRGADLAFGVAYGLRLRVQSGGGESRYCIRSWPADQAEPEGWALCATKRPEETPCGAAALLAHNTDVTFGRTRITPI